MRVLFRISAAEALLIVGSSAANCSSKPAGSALSATNVQYKTRTLGGSGSDSNNFGQKLLMG